MPRTSRASFPKLPTAMRTKKPRGFRAPSFEVSLADYLTGEGEGNSKLEALVDGAAKRMGIYFDERQKYIPLSYGFEKTIADYWVSSPPIAIFVDGIQHDLRADTAQADLIKRAQLEEMGIKVVVLNWKEILESPMAAVAKIWFEM